MHCYFLRDGHVSGIEGLDATTDAEAIAHAKALFAVRQPRFDPPLDDMEVWDVGRMVYRFSLAEQPKTA